MYYIQMFSRKLFFQQWKSNSKSVFFFYLKKKECQKYLITSVVPIRFLNTGNSLYFLNRNTGNIDLIPEFKKMVKDPRHFILGLKNFGGEFKKLYKEYQEKYYRNDTIFGPDPSHGRLDMVFVFETKEDLNKFIVHADCDIGGYSSASLTLSKGTAIFSGEISTKVPKGSDMKYSGYANFTSIDLMKSFKRPTTFDWKFYTHLVLKIRGDGRTYTIILSTPGQYDVTWNYQYQYPLYTRGGPYWQIIKIPFSHFYFTNAGKIGDNTHGDLFSDKVTKVGITLSDVYDGPFKLEIDYIGVERNEIQNMTCPYEEYAGVGHLD